MSTQQSSVYTVSELTQKIRESIESSCGFVKIKGEISSLRKQSSGHIYFTLKDERAQISSVLFHGYAKQAKRLPKDGDKVILEGNISVYAPQGKYQIIVTFIHFEGIGELLLKFHQLKMELQSLGWFAQEHKKMLSPCPKIIGIVTSPTGAVIQDIITILQRRLRSFHIIINPVKVQGNNAAQEIAQAINDFNKYTLASVLIVGRGGGSLEDLWAFNERCVAKAIFYSHIPVISAVGHETDFSLSDFVADLRAPTPSVAAELVAKKTSDYAEKIDTIQQSLHQILQRYIYFQSQKIDEMEIHWKRSWQNVLSYYKLLLKKMHAQFYQLAPKRQITFQKKQLGNLQNHIYIAFSSFLTRKRSLIQHMKNVIHSMHPKETLKRGYCICFDKKQKQQTVMRAKQAFVSQELSLLLFDGSIDVITKQVYLHE